MTKLRIIGVLPESPSTLSSDMYVLFTYENMPYPSNDLIYWRTISRRGLVDDIFTVKIDSGSGRIYSLTIIINHQGVINIDTFGTDNVIEGLPVVDTSDFDKKINDNNLPIDLYRHEDEFIVSINDLVIPTKCIKNGRVKFYLLDEKLVSIGFCDLTDDEMQIIETKM